MASAEIEPVSDPLKVPRNLVASLGSACHEWFLILFLFIDAMISYVITKFARGCKLQTPCLLCSRLDHVLGEERTGYHWELMCKRHKSEISSLVQCHSHDKLVDVHNMCENCLFSFATVNKSNAETYRLLVGKMGEDVNSDFDHEDSVVEDEKEGFLGGRNCACCDQPWVPRGNLRAMELIQTRLVDSDKADEFETVVSGSVDHEYDHELSRTVRDRDVSLIVSHSRKIERDPLPHIGYTELKLNSDTESEAIVSDDEDNHSASVEVGERGHHHEREFLVQSVESRSVVVDEFSFELTEPQIVTLNKDLGLEKPLDLETESKPSLLESQLMKEEEENGELLDCEPRESKVSIGHGLEELNWQEVGNEADSIATPTEKIDHASSTSVEVPLDVKNDDVVGQTCIAKSEEVIEREAPSNTTPETSSETNVVVSDNGYQATSSLELGDAYKMALDNRGKQYSDQWIVKDSSRVTEDLKVLLSQLSANRGFELPISDVSPKLSVNSDDVKSFDHSGSFSMQILQKRISLERNESGLSLDGSIISEVDGESVVDRLKRQVDHDRKIMSALYKELEEERSASAVATNQAMAMITRLQEEKAALHMEALQYLRMMEEQAEYDDDELQKSNDLLTDKEKEVQDLEAELEFYKKKCPNERYLETIGDIRITDIGVDDSKNSRIRDDHDELDFEDERACILQSLKKLENTVYLLCDDDYDCSEKHDELELNGKSDFVEQSCVSKSSQPTDLASLGKRLEALEEDRRFLEHTVSSLRNGEEGVQFVQEIASHLLELRRIAMRKDQLVA